MVVVYWAEMRESTPNQSTLVSLPPAGWCGNISTRPLHTKPLINILLLAGFLLSQPQLLAQERPRHTLLDDPTKAWAEVQKVQEAVRPPADWQMHEPTAEQLAEFQKQIRQTAASFADKASEFIERFPTNENVGDARITVVHALSHAVAAGDADAEKRIAAFASTVLADQSIPEDDRVGVLMYSGNAAFMKKVGMRLFTEGMSKLREEFETASTENMRAALKQFPTNSMIYTMLVAVAQAPVGSGSAHRTRRGAIPDTRFAFIASHDG
jgi:hypothetical protein